MTASRIFAALLLLACAAIAQTTVADTVSLRPGVTWTGSITISWPAFTAADGRAVAAGQAVATVTNGALSTSPLWPSVGATWPTAGLSAAGPYTAVYLTTAGPDRGTRWTEVWNVPVTSPASLADVRRASSLAGNTIYSGTAVPADAMGSKGDFYVRNPGTAPCLYGPKPGVAWPGTCTVLVGPTGAPGIMQSGAAPPSNGVGADGQFYIDTASCLWGPKAAGAWPGSCTSLIGPPGGVNSFAGRSGAITPQAGDYSSSQITESGNLYFTNLRVLSVMAGLYEVPLSFSGLLARSGNAVACPLCARADQTLFAVAAPKPDGYYCVQVVGSVPSLTNTGCPGAGGGGGGGGGALTLSALTNSTLASLTNSTLLTMGN